MRRSMSSARSPTLCSRCSSAKVESMWRMAMTLAVEVMMITASTSMKLPNVSWPIESENDRGGSEFGGVSAVMWVGPGSCRAQYTMYFGPWGTCRPVVNGGISAGFRGAERIAARSHLDHSRPQRSRQIRRHHAEHVAKCAGKMRRAGKAGGVGRFRKRSALAAGANSRAHPVPDAVAPQWHARLRLEQMEEPRRRQARPRRQGRQPVGPLRFI